MTHKYQVRQLVLLANPCSYKGRPNSTGVFEVTRLMPADQTGELPYRVKSSVSGERAMCEWEIAGLAAEYL